VNGSTKPGKPKQNTLQCTAGSVMWVSVWGNVLESTIQGQTAGHIDVSFMNKWIQMKGFFFW
jgi:hypothetical protein